jgi:hypothetical protein
MVPDEKVDELLRQLHELDLEKEMQGMHAFVWNIEQSI